MAHVFERLGLKGLWTYTPRRVSDTRGWFCESFNQARFSDHLIGVAFVQDNHSLSAARGTLRGLHYQRPPRSQDKLVRVLRGAILDVAVDIRRRSPTYGQWASVVLSDDNAKQLFVPKGFAHGFVTLADATEVLYKVSDFYSPDHEEGIAWNDEALSITWGFAENEIVISERDARLPRLAEAAPFF